MMRFGKSAPPAGGDGVAIPQSVGLLLDCGVAND